jgi:hypothetical protein
MRMLYRDVDQPAAARVPIYAERGRDGGLLAGGLACVQLGEAFSVFFGLPQS